MNGTTTEELDIKTAAERFGVSPRNLSYWCMRFVDGGIKMPEPFVSARREGLKRYWVTAAPTMPAPASPSTGDVE